MIAFQIQVRSLTVWAGVLGRVLWRRNGSSVMKRIN